MTLDEMREQAKAEVLAVNPKATALKVSKVYDHLMDGTLITVSFQDGSSTGKEDMSHVHFGRNGVRFYRYHSDVINEVSHYKERSWFFRFLEFAGIGGLIAFTLILVFSILLCVFAFSGKELNASIVEVVKLSFTTILGYFFGSQAAGKR
jgi:hypothetical protein